MISEGDEWVGGRYELLNVLGEGRYTVVRKAREGTTGATVAVKCVPKAEHRFTSSYIDRERNAFSIISSSSSAYVVDFVEFVEDQNFAYFVMEYVDGYSLDRVVIEDSKKTSCRGMSANDRKRVILDVIHGAQHLHGLSVYHCDIHPSNLLVGKDAVKIIDFGCSVVSPTSEVRLQRMCINTTPGFGPPELIAEGHGSPRILLDKVDVWSIGCLIYFVFTGIRPFVVKGSTYESLKAVRNIDVSFDLLSRDVRHVCESIFLRDATLRPDLSSLEKTVLSLDG